MKREKFDAFFQREFLFTFVLTEVICWCVIIIYAFDKIFYLDIGIGIKEVFAALIVSVICLIVYIFYRVLSMISN